MFTPSTEHFFQSLNVNSLIRQEIKIKIIWYLATTFMGFVSLYFDSGIAQAVKSLTFS